jgi:hypothetical protein
MWGTSPAESPHLNDLAETAVHLTKRSLGQAIGSRLLNYDELATTLAQIEAFLIQDS